MNLAVAKTLKEYRKAQKLSLDMLAKRASVSKSMIVEIEKGAANPSIGILCKLSVALGVSVADIVDVNDQTTPRVIESKDMPILWEGPLGGRAIMLAGTSGPHILELWHWEMASTEVFESQGHSQGSYEIVYVERGSLTLRVGEVVVVVSKGCSAVARTDVPHSYTNEGRSRLVYTMCVSENIP